MQDAQRRKPQKPTPPPHPPGRPPPEPPVKPPVRPPVKRAAGMGIAALIAWFAHWLGAHPAVVITLFVAALAAFAFIMSKQK